MSDLTLRFWGTRGSIPVPGHQTQKFGGNTTCMEIRHEDTVIVIDAGTGIRPLGKQLISDFPNGRHFQLIFTHTHWDHIQGLPFFGPAYIPSNKIDVYGRSLKLRETLEGQMQPVYFPIDFSAMAADIQFHKISPQFSIDGLNITTTELPHPGGCQGYRFETSDAALVIATDSELSFLGSNGSDEELAGNEHLMKFFEGADVIVIDCQYTDQEYAQKTGWGHNSISMVVDLCRRIQPGTMILTHHDPESDDRKVERMVLEASRRLRLLRVNSKIIGAKELETTTVSPTARAAKAS